MTLEAQFEQKHIQSIIKYNHKVERILNQATKDITKRIQQFELRHPPTIYRGSFYRLNRQLEKNIDGILGKLHKDIQSSIGDGVVSNWDMANLKNNKLVGKWADGIKLGSADIPTSFNQLNLAAMDSFIARTAAGMNISQRVWNLVNGAKDQVELLLSSGITTGKSAAGIARDIKIYLNEPERLFRRVRQEGKLVLSKAARGYKPGAGIYRSSYKNALRLTRTEINMAYRMSDFVRRKQLPFIIGIMVHLSASHPRLDLCDDLQGRYPVGFSFGGWHPNCICYTTSITLSKKDSLNFMKTGKIAKNRYITKIPSNAQKWLNNNKEKILGYKQLPYFIEQNYDKNFKLLKKANVPYLQKR